jgi:beta-1,4-mannosyl-glycoprotein beta-1,4-N-acetylglucosaminyltransferase
VILDAFPFAGTPTELLLLECRLTELYDVVDHFIVVEATVDHQDKPKPLNFPDNAELFKPWADKITYVIADQMPHIAPGESHQQDPWAREHAQREHIALGLHEIDAEPDDILLQSDLDEIPRPIVVRNLRLKGNELVAFHQKGHFWAIDWQYPDPPGWNGTVATRVGTLDKLRRPTCGPFSAMRDVRNSAPQVPNAGWHFSWLGGTRETWMQKVGSFCHPEVEERIVKHADSYFADGLHVDGQRMVPVTVDRTWPKWMQDPTNVPTSWYRPK